MGSFCVYLVTGGAGFIGSHLVDRLLELNCGRVILLDNFNDYYSQKIKKQNVDFVKERHSTRILDSSFIIIEGSINDEELLKTIFDKYKITHIVHLAALAGVRSSICQMQNYIETNYLCTQLLLNFACLHKVSVFVFASTSSVYGKTDILPFVETDPCSKPLSPYAATKRSAELLAHVYHHMQGLNVTILRLFNVYGPRGRPDMMPYKLMRACIDPTCIIDVFDNGEIKRDWTYIDDVVDAFILALEQKRGYEIINIGCGNPTKLTEFIEHIEQISGKIIAKQFMISHQTEPSITFCDNTKAQRLLNFIPKTNVREGLEKTWNWFRQQYRSHANYDSDD